MAQPLVYLSGRLVPQSEAALPLHDAGLISGATVTDFCRTFHRRLFRWPDHLRRFRRDCETCFIPLSLSDEEITHLAHDLVVNNSRYLSEGQELALITFATPGGLGTYAGLPGWDGPPTLVLHTFPLPFSRYRRFFTEGIALAFSGEQSALTNELLPAQIKHRSRMHWWRADQLVRRRTDVPPGAIALLADDTLTETAIGNLLVVRNGILYTPPRTKVLESISLRVVEELCFELGLVVEQRAITLSEAQTASEAMLTGTAFCLAGVRWLEGVHLECPGPITQRLLQAWNHLVGLDIAAQFLAS